jgi:hypothetical protein
MLTGVLDFAMHSSLRTALGIVPRPAFRTFSSTRCLDVHSTTSTYIQLCLVPEATAKQPRSLVPASSTTSPGSSWT